MILQTDKRLTEVINLYGCYFMSILYLVNKHTGLQLSTVKITKIFNDCKEYGYLDENGYILNAEKIFKHLGLNVKYTGIHEPPRRNCAKNEIEILCLKNSRRMSHFVVGTGKGHIAYNSMGRNNETYKLHSKRIFKLL